MSAKERQSSAILKTYRGSCRKSMGDPKGLGRDSIDRLRGNLYLLWANDVLNRKVNNREGAFRCGTGKACFSGVLKYIYEIFQVFKCHGARQSIADLRRLSKSPACRQSARYRMARSQQEIQSRDLYPSSARLTDRRGTRHWGVPAPISVLKGVLADVAKYSEFMPYTKE